MVTFDPQETNRPPALSVSYQAEMMEGWAADRQKADPMEVRDIVVSADGAFHL